MYDYAVFIGRFQPFHAGHRCIIDRALQEAKHVIVLVGSANLGRSIRNPFTFKERESMIDALYSKEVTHNRLIIEPINDHTYDLNGWIEEVQTTVYNTISKNETWSDYGPYDKTVALIGRNKDNSSFYLKMFPRWASIDAGDHCYQLLHATDIREAYFDPSKPLNYGDDLDPDTANWLEKFRYTDAFKNIYAEHQWCNKYRTPYEALPHPPTFNTTDAVILCSGHVLLVTRRSHPGKGLLALPGGYLNPDETLLDCAIRETFEETKFPKTLETHFRNSLRKQQSFDDVHRDPRGRFITHAFFFDLGNNDRLPAVRGGSDARKAEWVPVSQLRPDNMFADHYFIIRAMMK